MKPQPRFRMEIATAIVLSLLAGHVLNGQTATPRAPRKILFIGNSLTYFENGLYYHLERLASRANPPVLVTTEKSVFGGAFLKTLWEKAEPRALIAKRFDVVVVQEDLPETNVADFKRFARLFVAHIRRNGSRPVLLMAWDYPRLGWITMAGIAQAHREIGKELGVEIAPAGLAWKRAAKEQPTLKLYAPDGEHPSLAGTYLTTAVVYSTIYGQNPGPLAYVPDGMTAETAAFLRRIAWETVQGDRQQSR